MTGLTGAFQWLADWWPWLVESWRALAAITAAFIALGLWRGWWSHEHLRTVANVVAAIAACWALSVSFRALENGQKAVEVSAEALQTSQRSWVLYDDSRRPEIQMKDRSVVLWVRNFGRSPAFDVRPSARASTGCGVARGLVDNQTEIADPPGNSYILAPRQGVDVGSGAYIAIPIDHEPSDDEPFYVWASVTYIDRLHEGRRRSTFCLGIHPAETDPKKRFQVDRAWSSAE